MAMGRTRKKDRHLPSRMYQKHGCFWFVDKRNKWHRLDPDYATALTRYATLIGPIKYDTIDLLISRYINEILPKRSKDTAKGRKKEFVRIRRAFGQMAPKDFQAYHAWEYFEKRGSNQAALHEIRALSAVMGWAGKWGVVQINPLLNIGIPTFKPRGRYVTDDEFTRVRDCAPLMVRVAMNIALITGARQKDILELTRRQVAAGLLQVKQSKTGKKIDYPVAGSLDENIQLALAEKPQLRQFVIVNRAGKRYTRDGFQTQWKRAVTKAFPDKADRFTFHDIRAKSLLDADTLEQAQIRAGHADSEFTQQVYWRKTEVATVKDFTHLKGAK